MQIYSEVSLPAFRGLSRLVLRIAAQLIICVLVCLLTNYLLCLYMRTKLLLNKRAFIALDGSREPTEISCGPRQVFLK